MNKAIRSPFEDMGFAGLDTTRLRVFREVARQSSFTAAATTLHISQPAVSQHIARLEQDVGCALLERSSRRVRPTPAGAALLRHAELLLTGLAEARRELAALTAPATGPLRVAVFPSAIATFVPAAVGALRELYPGVGVTLIEADPPQSVPQVLSGDVDLAVVYDYPTVGGAPDARLRRTILAGDPMALVLPADDARATDAATAVDLSTLARDNWIVPGPSLCRTALFEACRRAGFTPDVVSETNDYQAMIGLVAAKVGLAVVPRLAAPFARARGVRLLPLQGTRLLRRVEVADRKAGAATSVLDGLRSLLARELDAALVAAEVGARPAVAGLGA